MGACNRGLQTSYIEFSDNFAVWVSRVTTADLRKEPVRIVIEHIRRNMSLIGRLLLVLAGSMTVGTPSVLGQGTAALSGTAPLAATVGVKLPAFDVISIKPNKSDSGMIRVMYKPDGYSATNISLKMLILGAYGLKEGPALRTAELGRVSTI